MIIIWSNAAQRNLDRLYEFLAAQDLEQADRLLDALIAAPEQLLAFPRRGPKLSEFEPREVREFRTGRYILRYEFKIDKVLILRAFHAREDRFST